MRIRRLLLAAASCLAPAYATYTYDYANLLNPYNVSQWTSNGYNNAANGEYSSLSYIGGSLIFNSSVPYPSNSYELRYTLRLQNNPGSFITYLRATPNSQMVSGNTGTFYAVEIVNATFSGGSCSATLNIHKQDQ